MNFICDLCDFKSLLRSRMVSHMKNRHMPKELREKFHCSICDFTSINKDYIKGHIRSHQNPEVFTCHCGKEFMNKHNFARHQRIVHLKDYKFKCRFCHRTYGDKAQLHEHTLIQHTKKNVRNVICRICSKGFITAKQLKAHFNEVHCEGTIKCAECGKTFTKNSKLSRHLKSHTKVKDFHCGQCDASYSHATHLYRHQEIVHLGLKLFCEIPGCSTTFVRRDNYRNHLKKSHKNLAMDFIEASIKRAKFVN